MTVPDVADPGAGQRGRILDAALALMSELGAAGTSMRRLAAACGLNVATIYHYFPSKADLLRALIEERRYGERMAAEDPPADPDLPPAERLAVFFAWLAARTLEEDVILRLLVGEGLHGNETARQSARALVDATDAAVAGWLEAGFPELAVPPPVASRLVRGALLALVTEHLATGAGDPDAYGRALAAALVSSPGP